MDLEDWSVGRRGAGCESDTGMERERWMLDPSCRHQDLDLSRARQRHLRSKPATWRQTTIRWGLAPLESGQTLSPLRTATICPLHAPLPRAEPRIGSGSQSRLFSLGQTQNSILWSCSALSAPSACTVQAALHSFAALDKVVADVVHLGRLRRSIGAGGQRDFAAVLVAEQHN